MHSNCAGQSPQSTSHSDSLRSCPSSRLCWLMWAQHSPLANISPYSEQTIGFLKSSKKPAFHAPVAERGETQPHRQVLGSKKRPSPTPAPQTLTVRTTSQGTGVRQPLVPASEAVLKPGWPCTPSPSRVTVKCPESPGDLYGSFLFCVHQEFSEALCKHKNGSLPRGTVFMISS